MAIPKIVVLSEIMRGKTFELTGDQYSIGRSEERTICIPDGTISTHHCDIVRKADGFTVIDRGSTNGTRINGIRISEQKLVTSDILQVGGIELLFDCEEKANTTVITSNTTQINLNNDLQGLSNTGKIGGIGNISNIKKDNSGEDGKVKLVFYAVIGVLALVVITLIGVLAKKFLT